MNEQESRAAESEPTDEKVSPGEYVAFEAWFRALPEPEKIGKHQSWIGWHERALRAKLSSIEAAPVQGAEQSDWRAERRKQRTGCVPNCNDGNNCPWTDGDEHESYCRACGLRAQGSCQ